MVELLLRTAGLTCTWVPLAGLYLQVDLPLLEFLLRAAGLRGAVDVFRPRAWGAVIPHGYKTLWRVVGALRRVSISQTTTLYQERARLETHRVGTTLR